jgi:hypothetical protein
MTKKCIVCGHEKEIKKEGTLKPHSFFEKYFKKYIHEYNFSCYECLDNAKKEREKELLDIEHKLQIIGILDDFKQN